MSRTLTAPLAIIKFDGVAIGKIKTFRVTETINRGEVRGIGTFTPDEAPALSWSGTANASAYLINFDKFLNFSANGKVVQRRVSTPEEFIDTILLMEEGLTIDLLRKVKGNNQPNPTNGIYSNTQLESFASITGAFLTKEGMDISENQISGRDADFVFIDPILYSL